MERLILGSTSEKIEVAAGESLSLSFVVLSSSETIDLQIDINGEGATVDIKGLYLCKEDEQVNINIALNHNCPNSTSHQLIKGIVGGKARASFYGKITVAPDAQNTEALQENHNLLLSETAVATTKPQLEIYADDVKCSHGATIGALSEDEAFYMRSRGIPAPEARRLQLLSFLTPVIPSAPRSSLYKRICKAL